MFKRSAAQGFTLVELLVVISVIGILMTILIPTMGKIKDRVRVTVTKQLVSTMGSALTQYMRDEGVYCPDKDGGMECAESLVRYLGGPAVNRDKADSRHTEKTYHEFKNESLTDHDGDRWTEVADPWTRPMLYVVGPNAGDIGAEPPYHRKDSYDMYSVGPDGITGRDTSGFRYPACVNNGSFYKIATDDKLDGDYMASRNEAPGSTDDIANF